MRCRRVRSGTELHLVRAENSDRWRPEWVERLAATPLEAVRGDPQLTRFAMKAGASAFGLHCAQCHGTGAQGFPGYPNLNDDAWLWGGSLAAIHHTIAHGVRNADSDEARFSEMPAFADLLGREEIADAAQYVLALGGLEHDAAAAERGEQVYEIQCATCHGIDGAGEPDIGAPRLNDALWLFAGDAERIAAQIAAPEHGVMPAWGRRLDAPTVKALALYVHGLGGGE